MYLGWRQVRYQVNCGNVLTMKPYPRSLRMRVVTNQLITVLLCFAPLCAHAAAPKKTDSGPRLSISDAATRSGFQHLYNLEFDRAVSDFERSVQAHPKDPYALNHLLQAVLQQELYRLNAMDTTLYADNGFLTGKSLPADPEAKQRILELADDGLRLEEERLKEDPDDVEALYARGVTRGLKLTYVALVEKSFFAALRNAAGARSDHERVLQLDPHYTDAKLILGVHNYIIGSLSLPAKILAGLAGLTGNKKKGLEYLKEVAESGSESSVDARAALALFLRREGRYEDALEVARTLTAQFPHNFIFALEEANLLKDAGQGQEAIAAYSKLLDRGKSGYYPNPHLERAAYGLAESYKGQRKAADALQNYQAALQFTNVDPEMAYRSLLGAGQMYDVLSRRQEAVAAYERLLESAPESRQASAAKKFLRQPFHYPG